MQSAERAGALHVELVFHGSVSHCPYAKTAPSASPTGLEEKPVWEPHQMGRCRRQNQNELL
jgi:hypothetical protein